MNTSSATIWNYQWVFSHLSDFIPAASSSLRRNLESSDPPSQLPKEPVTPDKAKGGDSVDPPAAGMSCAHCDYICNIVTSSCQFSSGCTFNKPSLLIFYFAASSSARPDRVPPLPSQPQEQRSPSISILEVHSLDQPDLGTLNWEALHILRKWG